VLDVVLGGGLPVVQETELVALGRPS
jgi:hypothetical protein